MSTPISVVIPTFNRAEVVPFAIQSVLAQTLPAAEIIVVDDGSAHDMRVALAHFGGRVRVIRQENTGLSGARNTGINAAGSEWIAFLDDDDEHEPDRLARAAESIRKHPTADVHLTNTAIVSEDGSPKIDLFRLRGVPIDEWMVVEHPLDWAIRGCFFAQSLVVRRSALEAVGLFRRTFYEDLDLYIRLVARSPWIVDGKPGLRLIRRGNTNAMSDDWRARPITRCEALVRIHREALALPGLKLEEIRQVRGGLATYLFELGSALSFNGQERAAQVKFLEAAGMFPHLHSRLKARAAAHVGRPFLKLLHKFAGRRQGLVR